MTCLMCRADCLLVCCISKLASGLLPWRSSLRWRTVAAASNINCITFRWVSGLPQLGSDPPHPDTIRAGGEKEGEDGASRWDRVAV